MSNSVKRVTLFAGHYGSGKTNCAINYALHLRSSGLPVAIADLDVVNPYFRTVDSMAELVSAGIRVVASDYAASNVDFPALPGEMYSLFEDKSSYAVIDLGGDDRGALALGRYRDLILEENDFNNFLVINKYRPLTATPALCMEVMEEISSAAGIPFTGIVNNSNLGAETTWEDIEKSIPYAKAVSSMSGLPIVMTTYMDSLTVLGALDIPLFGLSLQKKVFEED
ncbi:MAG: hypothetical protein IJR10_01025 [Clostridia bacterium]|nr:hypothetical protein [Clostridia bacterium]